MSNDNLLGCEETVESLGIDVPAWIDHDRETSIRANDVAAILQGGCASGAWMDAVTYSTARDIMAAHGDDVLGYLQDTLGELPKPSDDESWSGMAVHYLSAAVELWCGSVEDELRDAIEAAQEEADA